MFSSYKDHTIFMLDPRTRTVFVLLVIKTYLKTFFQRDKNAEEAIISCSFLKGRKSYKLNE